MGERNRFAFDRDYYNKIGAKLVSGSAARKLASEPENEADLEEYLTATYAPEYRNSFKKSFSEKRENTQAHRPVRTEHTEGNTVRTAPARKPRTEMAAPVRETRPTEAPSQQTGTTTEFKTKYLIRINYLRVIIIAALIVVVVQSALNLLSVKCDVNRIEKEISTAKITLEDVNSYNESLLGQLDISYDRNYIYNVAVGRLGMVYPKDNAVVYYKAADTGHVIQYRDIP